MLGIKYPPTEVHDGSDPSGIQLTFDLRQHLFKPPGRSSLRHTPKFCRRAGPRQRRPDSSRHSDSYGSWTSPMTSPAGSARTPTGAGLRPRLELQVDFTRAPTGVGSRPQLRMQKGSAWTPTGAGPHPRLHLQAPHGLLQEPDSAHDSSCK